MISTQKKYTYNHKKLRIIIGGSRERKHRSRVGLSQGRVPPPPIKRSEPTYRRNVWWTYRVPTGSGRGDERTHSANIWAGMFRQAAVVAKVAEIFGNLKGTSVKSLRHASNVFATGVTVMAGRTNTAPCAAVIIEAHLAALDVEKEAQRKEKTSILTEFGRKTEELGIAVARLGEDRLQDTDRKNEMEVVSKQTTGRIYTGALITSATKGGQAAIIEWQTVESRRKSKKTSAEKYPSKTTPGSGSKNPRKAPKRRTENAGKRGEKGTLGTSMLTHRRGPLASPTEGGASHRTGRRRPISGLWTGGRPAHAWRCGAPLWSPPRRLFRTTSTSWVAPTPLDTIGRRWTPLDDVGRRWTPWDAVEQREMRACVLNLIIHVVSKRRKRGVRFATLLGFSMVTWIKSLSQTNTLTLFITE